MTTVDVVNGSALSFVQRPTINRICLNIVSSAAKVLWLYLNLPKRSWAISLEWEDNTDNKEWLVGLDHSSHLDNSMDSDHSRMANTDNGSRSIRMHLSSSNMVELHMDNSNMDSTDSSLMEHSLMDNSRMDNSHMVSHRHTDSSHHTVNKE